MLSNHEDGHHSLTKKLTGDTARYVPAAVIPALASIAGVAIYTRIFAPLEYGRYALVLAFVTITTSVFAGWIQQSVLRYLQQFKAENRLREFIAKLFVLLAHIFVSVIVIAAALFLVIRSELGAYTLLFFPAVFLIVTETTVLTVTTVFQSDLRSKLFSFYRALQFVLRLLLALGFIFFVRHDVVGLLIGGVIANLIVILPMTKHLGVWKDIRTNPKSVDLAFLRMSLAYGLPMVGWMLGGQVLEISDRLLIGALRGSSEVGIYSANYSLVMMAFGLVSTPILTAAYPLVMASWEHGKKADISTVIGSFSRYYFLLLLPVVAFVGVFSHEIVSIVLGSGFREGHVIIPIVLAGTFLWGLAMIGHKGLELREKTKIMFYLILISAIANIGMNFIAIPKYGYIGAAVTTLISYALYPLLLFFVSRRFIPWRIPWASIAKGLVAGALMTAVLILMRTFLPSGIVVVVRLVIAGIIGLAIYAISLKMMGEMRKSDLPASTTTD